MADPWAQTILSNPATVARMIRGKKGGAEIKASPPLSRPIIVASSAPCASQNSNPAKSASSRTTCQTKDLLHTITRSFSSKEIHSTETKNGSRRLKKKLVSLLKFMDPEQDTLIARKMGRKSSQLLPHSNLDPFGG